MTSSADSPPRRGYPRTFSGLAGALIASLVLIAFVWGLGWFQRRGNPDPTPTVHYGAALAEARQEAPFHLLAPVPVPAGLRATSVSWGDSGSQLTWHLGFLTSQQQYVGLYQGNGPRNEFLASYTPATHRAAPVTIDGTRWQVLTDPAQGETALVRSGNGVTVLVTGTAGEGLIEEFTRNLR